MDENVRIMLEKLANDEEAMRKLSAVRNPDEAYAIVSAIQGGFTKEEFIETMKTLNGQISQDLSENDLVHTSGGEVDTETVTVAVSGGVTTGIITITLSCGATGVISSIAGGASAAAV